MLSVEEILAATRGTLVRGDAADRVSGVSTDSRTVGAGDCYVPLAGDRFDGHSFLAEAQRRGAAAVLCDRDVPVPDGPAIVRVPDTLVAFGDLARFWRRKLAVKVVAVTGSSGKTSTKEAVADLLGRFAPTAKSHANFNNEIGVPLTLLGLRPGPVATAVLELAMRGPGEIRYLADIAEPDIGVITNVGTAHIGRLGSREAIARAKGELVGAMPGGIVVLNGDDDLCRALGASHPRARYFSTKRREGADVWADGSLLEAGDGWAFQAAWQTGSTRVQLALPGDHHVANALAAIAVALALGHELPAGFTLAPAPVGGRSRLVAVGDVEVLDESYNANPESVLATLETFCKLPCHGRRVAVLGDMAELGDHSEEAHRAVGRALDAMPIDVVVAVGELAGLIAAATTREAITCRSNGEAVDALGRLLRAGDRLLVKGSRAGRLEEILAGLSEVYA